MPVLGVVQLQAILSEAFPDVATPVVDDVNDVFALLSFPVSANHGRPGGTLSGPVMMSLADTAAWVAIMSQIGPVLLAVTTSLHIDFLRKPSLDLDLMARARLLKLGRKLAVVDVELFSRGADELVAKAQVTYALPSVPPETAIGRPGDR